jgi:uncharacterized protein (DUF302 family)
MAMNTTRFTVDHLCAASDKPFDEAQADFERQLGRFDPAALQSVNENPQAAKARFEAMAGPSGLMLFEVRNHGSLLSIAGLTRKALQYVVGNPVYASQMTQHAIGASLYAPLRMLLYENDEGRTCIEYDRPSSLFGQFGDARINQVAASLDQKLEALAAAALGPALVATVRQGTPTLRPPNDPGDPSRLQE